ncbi:DUF2177 family protein [Nocardioides sp.]|uniref:DUF2177 family protein n=1 Tax=Nocardioides sp. TaxID=35761 RepID=UPI0027373C9E|nr:DUF2177 family protein [Nocardioides sp.]MDP3891284.1 DUF2177 family protein [Nocardioides sp.]
MRTWISEYVVAVLVFAVLDALWLGAVAHRLYDDQLGHLLAESPNMVAAVVFYAIFLAGLVFFVIHPSVAAGSWRRAAATGGFFGLVTYATWDLTNLAVLEGFPVTIVPIDLAWGTVVAATTSVATYAGVRWLPVTGRGRRPPAPPAR